MGGEFYPGSDVEFAVAEVGTDKGADGPASLGTVEVLVGYESMHRCHGLKALGTFSILGGSSGGSGGLGRVDVLQLLRCFRILLCLALQHRAYLTQLRKGVGHILGKILVLSRDVYTDVADVAFVFVVNVVETETTVYRPVVADFIRGTQLKAEDVLLTVNITFHRIARCGGAKAKADTGEFGKLGIFGIHL